MKKPGLQIHIKPLVILEKKKFSGIQFQRVRSL